MVQHSIDRQVKRWEKANCSTLLKRITKLKCVNSEIKSNVKSTAWKGTPRGVPTILSNRQEGHTCLEKAFRIVDLEWNVSFVQTRNRTPGHKWYDCSGMSSEMDWSSPNKNDRSAINWLKIDQLKKANCWSRHGGSWVSHVPWQKIENCRYVFTPMLSGLRWSGQTIMGSWPPAWKRIEVLHLFRCFTHTDIHTNMHTYITLHYIALHCVALHYITLHYINTYIHINICN